MQYLNANTPTVVTLKANTGKKRGQGRRQWPGRCAPIHDMGPRRAPVDPGLARRPAERVLTPLLDMRVRVLANGLKRRHVARQLGADLRRAPDLQRGHCRRALESPRCGPARRAHADDGICTTSTISSRLSAPAECATPRSPPDRTTFSATRPRSQPRPRARGVAPMGPRRHLRRYRRHLRSRAATRGQGRRRSRSVDRRLANGTIRRGSPVRRCRPGASRQQLAHARRRHRVSREPLHTRQPVLTLVIAGHFDPAAAERWIEFLFADSAWARRALHTSTPVVGQPTAIARVDDTSRSVTAAGSRCLR